MEQFFRHFSGTFKGEQYESERPPSEWFENNKRCQPFVNFIRRTLIERVENGAISVLGRVGEVQLPHLVMPLTVEPSKPRLCHDARFLNLWMMDSPVILDHVTDLPRYVFEDSYQTTLDDKSGYDHLLLDDESRTYFGIQWGGWLLTYNTLPFGWKESPMIYHSTGLVATNYFRSINIPGSLYIDDRHSGQLQVDLAAGAYEAKMSMSERNLAAANAASFLVSYYLIKLGYFLGLQKSVSYGDSHWISLILMHNWIGMFV